MTITIKDVRAKFPQYADLDDDQLANALHGKFYADLPKDEFFSAIGLGAQAPEVLESPMPQSRPLPAIEASPVPQERPTGIAMTQSPAPKPRPMEYGITGSAEAAAGAPSFGGGEVNMATAQLLSALSPQPARPVAPQPGPPKVDPLLAAMLPQNPAGPRQIGVTGAMTGGAGAPASAAAGVQPSPLAGILQMLDSQPQAPAAPAAPDPFAGEGMGDLLKRRGQQVATGAASMASGALRGLQQNAAIVPQLEQETAPYYVDLWRGRMKEATDALAAGVSPDTGEPLSPREIASYQATQKTATYQLDRLGAILSEAPVDPNAGPFADAAAAVDRATESTVGKPDPRDTGFFSQLASGLGSMLGFAGASIATGGNPVAVAALGDLSNADAGFQDAKQAGASDSVAMQSSALNGLLGMSEAVPIERALHALPAKIRSKVGAMFGDKLLSILQSSGEEAVQEFVQQVGQNLNAAMTYDPNRSATEGAGTNALIGALLGGSMAAGGMALNGGKEAPAVPAVAPGKEQPEQKAPKAAPPAVDPLIAAMTGQVGPEPATPQAPPAPKAEAAPVVPDALAVPQEPAAAQGTAKPQADTTTPAKPAPAAGQAITEADALANPDRYEILDASEGTGSSWTDTGTRVVLDTQTGQVYPLAPSTPAQAVGATGDGTAGKQPQANGAPDVGSSAPPAADSTPAATAPAPEAAVPAQIDTATGKPPASWVIRNKETGEVVLETSDKAKVNALNTAKYEAVPIGDYLGSINGQNGQSAPEPTPQQGAVAAKPAPTAEIPHKVIKADTSVTPTGTPVQVDYAIVPLASLTASNSDDGRINPKYPQERQPRDRTDGKSEQQIQRIMRDFNPRMLDQSPTTDNGAPIVDPAGIVESGNGRTMMLNRMYRDRPDLAASYQGHLKAQGYPVDGVKNPVLVRIRRTDMTPEEIASYTRDSNTDTKLSMSATEQAMTDSKAMPDEAMSLYRGGDIDAAPNRPFVMSFLRNVVPENEHGTMVDRNGGMSQEAVRRIGGAMLAKAYGDADLISKLIEAADNNIKSIGGALLDVSPAWAKMRAAARNGTIAPEMDQTAALIEAVRLVNRARTEGRNVIEYVKQPDLLSGDGISPMGQRFLALMFRDVRQWTKPAGRDRMVDAFSFYVDEAMKTAPGADMFGGSANPDATLALTKTKQDEKDGSTEQQIDLFAPKAPAGNGGGVRPAEGNGTGPGQQGATDQGRPVSPQGSQPAAVKPQGVSWIGSKTGDLLTNGDYVALRGIRAKWQADGLAVVLGGRVLLDGKPSTWGVTVSRPIEKSEVDAAVAKVKAQREKDIQSDKDATKARPGMELITPAEDTEVGANAAGEKLYERKDGSRYRMRMDRNDRPNGYPDFGGDLAPVDPADTFESVAAWGRAVLDALKAKISRTGSARVVVSRERIIDLKTAQQVDEGFRGLKDGIYVRRGKTWDLMGIAEADNLASSLGLPSRFEAVPPTAAPEKLSVADQIDAAAAKLGVDISGEERGQIIAKMRDDETAEEAVKAFAAWRDGAAKPLISTLAPPDAAIVKAINSIVTPENKDASDWFISGNMDVQFNPARDGDVQIEITKRTSRYEGRKKLTSAITKKKLYSEIKDYLSPEARAAIEAYAVEDVETEPSAPITYPTTLEAVAMKPRPGEGRMTHIYAEYRGKRYYLAGVHGAPGAAIGEWHKTYPQEGVRILSTDRADLTSINGQTDELEAAIAELEDKAKPGRDYLAASRAAIDRHTRGTDRTPTSGNDLLMPGDNAAFFDAMAAAKTIERKQKIASDHVLALGKKTGKEHVVLLNADGEILEFRNGTKDGVCFTDALVRAIEAGEVVFSVHNHPSNRGASRLDLKTMLMGAPNLKIMGHKGAVHLLNKSKKAEKLDSARILEAFDAMEGRLTRLMQGEVNALRPTPDAANLHVDHLNRHYATVIMLALDRAGLIEYEGTAQADLAAAGVNLDDYLPELFAAASPGLGRAGFALPEIGNQGSTGRTESQPSEAGTGSGSDGGSDRLPGKHPADGNGSGRPPSEGVKTRKPGKKPGKKAAKTSPAKPATTGNAAIDGALDDIFGTETDNVPSPGERVEPDRGNAGSQDGLGKPDVSAAAGSTRSGDGKRTAAGKGGNRKQSGSSRLPSDNAAPVGGGGNSQLAGSDRTGAAKPADSGNGARGDGGSTGGLPSGTAGTGNSAANASSGTARPKLTPAERLAAIRNAMKEETADFVTKGVAESAPRLESPAFKAWFGDSKVVDADGKPLVVYHGTGKDFEAFDPLRSGSSIDSGFLGAGIYMTNRPRIADYYAEVAAKYGAGQNLMPLYISLQNPFMWGEKTFGVRDLVNLGTPLPTEVHQAVIDRTGFKFDPDQEPDYTWERTLSAALTDVLKERGYDGVIASTNDGAAVGEIVAFSPTQIKSVNNRGTWDGSNPNMLAEDTAPLIDQRKYETLEELFIGAIEGADVGRLSDRQLYGAIIKPLMEVGMTREEVANLLPYLETFYTNLKSGRVNLTPDVAPPAPPIQSEDRAERQAKADRIKPIAANEANIRATLPLLLDVQQDDVLKVETRFAKPNGHGMMITNGTGTGKTFSGGGVVKRFVQMGKGNVLIVAPSDAVMAGWGRALDALGVPAEQLKSTKDAGHGVVMTTYANLRDNNALAGRSWDLIVPDESQNLMSAANGEPTAALQNLRAITHRPADLAHKSQMIHAAEWARVKAMRDGDAKTAAYHALIEVQEAEVAKWAQEPRSKVLFLSATPFAYDKTVDYAEGYLFDYPKDGHVGNSRQSGQNLFMVENFGYRIRYHKLTKPEAAVDSAVFERQFHEKLVREGVLTGRSLQVDVDYDRRFVKAEDAQGNDVDKALDALDALARAESDKVSAAYKSGDMEGLRKDRVFGALQAHMRKNFDYLARMQLLESIKARIAAEDIKKHLTLGRKVVVFHDFNVGGGMNPFTYLKMRETVINAETGETDSVPVSPMTDKAAEGYRQLLIAHPWIADLNFTGYKAPIQHLPAALGKTVKLFNGTIPTKQRLQNLADFNMDGSGVDVLVVQADAGGAGISMHDLTGTHQRVLINLGMPTKPTTTLQEEGRILRVGTMTNAPFRYYTIGTAWERQAFASRIAERSGTVENLALGNGARDLLNGFIDAYEEAEAIEPGPTDGTGGKARDRAAATASPYEIAKTHYFGRTKTKGRRDQREGLDFYPTPEPLGLKMVEWAGIRPNERVLEPSAGDGSIARYVPDYADLTMIEPSSDLASRAQLRASHGKVIENTFENYHLVNKAHVIVMNPPFGSGGKTAMEHLAKAAKHLRDGGRIVALIPSGPSADKRFTSWYESDEAKGFYVTMDVSLPAVTFERASTSVMARVVIIDKVAPEDSPNGQRRDLRGEKTIGEFFSRIEDMTVPARPAAKQDVIEELEAEGQDATAPVPNVRPAAPLAPDVGGASAFKTGETVHAKTGAQLFVATIKDKVDREAYNAILAVAKAHGGYYSSFRGNGAIPGFQFKSAEDRKAFLDDMQKPTVGMAEDSGPVLRTDTAAFRKWFGDSKVVDADGKPLVVYHGSDEERDIIRPGVRSPGAWFTRYMQNAASYARGENATVHNVYLSIQNPLVVEVSGGEWIGYTISFDGETFSDDEFATNEDIVKEAQSRGFDGVFFKGGNFTEADDTWVAFSPEQIKSVNNRGTWDANDPRIQYQVTPPQLVRDATFATGEIAKVMPALRAELDRLDLKRVRLARDAGANWQGMFQVTGDGGLEIVIGASLDPVKTLHHEVIHALRTMNLFTETEWRALELAATKGWIEKHDIVQRYPDLLPSEQIEEAIAEEFSEALAVKKSPKGSALVTAFNKIARIFRAFRNALNGAGFNTAEGIFGRVLAGEISKRQAGNTGMVAGMAQSQPKFARQPLAMRPLTPQARANRNSGMFGSLFIPDRRVWEELTQAGAPIWGRIAGAKGAAADAVDRARAKIQDRFLPILRAQQSVEATIGHPVNEDQNAWAKTKTFSGRTAKHLRDIDNDYLKPIIKIIADTKGGLTADSVGTWLYARHAEERNKRIASINPNMPDGGSGMMDAEAQQILADAANSPHAAQLVEIGRLIDAMREWSLMMRERAGLITHADANLWRAMYKHYVPLKGFSETDHSESVLDVAGMGRRFSTRGPESKRAMGRGSEAFNPLQGAVTQAQEASIRSEKNRVGQALYDLAKNFPSPELWSVKTPTQKRYFNRTTGLVETRVEDPVSMILDPNEMAVKVGGKEHRILFHDERLARSAGTVGADQMGSFIAAMSTVMMFWRAVRTSLSPAFVLKNAIRDTIFSQINLEALAGKDAGKIRSATIKGLPFAVAGIYRGEGGKKDTTWSKYYDEFQNVGAKVSFWRMEDPIIAKSDMQRRIYLATGNTAVRLGKRMISPKAIFSNRDNPVLAFTERVNLAIENATRLSTYIAARQAGWSEQKAAILARDITLDFNTKGEWGATINALYGFFNAGMQGAYTVGKSLKSRKVKLIAGALIGAGFLLGQMNASLSDRDKDGVLAYDKIPNYQSQMSLQFMLGQDSDMAASIPLPYGFNLFPYLGQQMEKLNRGVKSPDRILSDMAAAAMGAFSPINGGDMYSFLTPSLGDPLLDMARNRDWLLRPIKPDYDFDRRPESQKAFGGATEASKAIAETLNRWTGGTTGLSGGIDVSPEYIDYIGAFVTGSAGTFWGSSVDLAAKAMTGDMTGVEINDVPIVKDFIHTTPDYLDSSRYFTFRDEINAAAYAVKTSATTGEPLPAKVKKWASLAGPLKAAEKARKNGQDIFLQFNGLVTKTMGQIAE